ncbi:COBRA-like protein 10 [Sarracenia purpurea var. burkii]
MSICCRKNPKFKSKSVKTKFMPRQYGDMSLSYDVLQAFDGNYLAQVTIENVNPLGRLDHWNLTWEWMRGEFIYSMRGAYTHQIDPSDCIYGPQGQYYQSFDFSPVMNCQKYPVISDLPADRANDDKVGKLPFCCRNGTVLPTTMNATEARSIFQLQVYKMPPDLNRTALNPPQHWKINGILNPDYKCGPPNRVDPMEFPDPSGLAAKTSAIASWQVTCNITRPKPKQGRCCVSFSAYYADSAVPCNTCACGCSDDKKCNQNAPPLPIPPEVLLVPFANRSEKAKAWAAIKHRTLPKQLPCPDNCGVSINWHVSTDYKTGWTARMTLFNWKDYPFEDWFAAIQIEKAFPGYQNVYSFNGTKMPQLNDTIFFQGLKGLNYLEGEVNGSNPEKDPRVPGKQQSVISFLKKHTPGINVARGDGFPTRVIFNGEECALPSEFPKRSGGRRSRVSFPPAIVVAFATLLLTTDRRFR